MKRIDKNSKKSVEQGIHPGPVSRRKFLRTSAESGAVLAAVTAGASLPAQAQQTTSAPAAASASPREQRRQAALKLRSECAQMQFDETRAPSTNNGDETRYPDKRGNFTKSLPHNDTGEVDPKAYDEFLSILQSGDAARFEQFPRDAQANAKLSSPISAYAYEIVGADAQSVPLPPPPAFASAAHAFEMAEIFWHLLTVDVPLGEYDSNPLVLAATADLNAFTTKLAPRVGGKITPGTLFRGESAGDLIGPYISQFFWMDIPYGVKTIDQRYRPARKDQAFLTKFPEWVANQRGMRSATRAEFESTPRYISTNRDMAEWVHGDFNFQAALNAALIIQRWGDEAQAQNNPYLKSKTQSGGVTLGREAVTLLGQISTPSQKACYYHKWLVHRRARPDAFGGKLDLHLSRKKSFDIHSDLLKCDAVARSFALHGSRLLPMSYPEGSPMHPAYPAGHATNAGAGATLLKAFFNESYPIPNQVQPSADGSKLEPYTGPTLTIGNELNKMAHNVSLGRDAGGVHYRSDGIQGMWLGEAMTISVLCDYSRTYLERFSGYELTKFDGQKIRIANGKVTPI
ncbi:MAG: phosphoesterase [Acidobacteria bacterium]|nr:phosphoesterase [Acidobacteriota bacterium]